MSISIGPLAFPVAPLLWLLALALGHWAATRWAHARGGAGAAEQVSMALGLGVLIGFAASRLAFVVSAWPAYGASPTSALDIRDGGWSPWVGVLAASAWLSWRAVRRPPLAPPLIGGGLLALALWAALAFTVGTQRHLPVPDAALVALDGQAARLPELAQGHPSVINLWATWCAPCRVELPALAAAQAARPEVRFLFVNQGESATTVAAFLRAQPYRLHGVWLDAGSATGTLSGSSGLPTTLIYDSRGRLVHRHFGILTEAALHARLAGLR